jgi:hypothetical protein
LVETQNIGRENQAHIVHQNSLEMYKNSEVYKKTIKDLAREKSARHLLKGIKEEEEKEGEALQMNLGSNALKAEEGLTKGREKEENEIGIHQPQEAEDGTRRISLNTCFK